MVTQTKWFADMIELESIEAPQTPVAPSNENPDSRVNVKVTLANWREVISILNPNRCEAPNGDPGIDTTTTVTLESTGIERIDTSCIPKITESWTGDLFPPKRTDLYFEFPAPENDSGSIETHTLSSFIQLNGSGHTSAERRVQFEVAPADGSGDIDPPPGDDGDDGDDGGDGGDGGDGDTDGSPMERLLDFIDQLPFLVTIVAIALIAKAIADVIGD